MASTKQMQERAKAARKAAKPAYVKPQKLIRAGYFYKANKMGMTVMFGGPKGPMNPHGFDMETHSIIIDNATSYDEAWHLVNTTGTLDGETCTPEQLVKDYFEQLEVITWNNANGFAPDLSDIVTFVQNVEWLTKNGFLKQDEYNGTSYAYTA